MVRRQPALTFAGALKILGKHEPGIVEKLDKALGGLILGAGATAAIGPAGLLAAIWGWIDQKNEAIGLLRNLTTALSNRVAGTKGLERRELILAAHSTIVAASVFEMLEEDLGKKTFESLEITDKERRSLTMSSRALNKDYFESIYQNEIPAPSPSRGFEENTQHLIDWAARAAAAFEFFIRGLAAGERIPPLREGFSHRAVDRYRSHYVAMAERVPEFLIWSMLGEHAATRHDIGKLDIAVQAALSTQGEALARVEALLSLVAQANGQIGRQREGLRNANLGVLDQPLVAGDAERYDTLITYPSIEQAFVAPHYRIARHDRECRPADESWWDARPGANDLELLLAAYLTSGDATRVPMLLLGHPGAGKSMLTKVLAARLPAADYTVVRVPLRNVAAGAPIINQIQQALDAATNARVNWQQLTDESTDTVRLVLLDGLDELLQAATFDRSAYLQEVMEFQRIEGEQGRPVAVVVTSRTVVADRVDIPPDTTIVKLDEFDDDQLATWLDIWRAANAGAIAAGTVHELTVAEAHHQIDLARQPLLLLMLAIYAADPKSPGLDSGLSRSALYERIFDNFARREVQKRATTPLRGKALESAVADQLYRLSVAALAMFNRGAQQLREPDLRSDLAALRTGEVAEDAGERVLGEFFFVHTPEARMRTKERSYEFLHATFGEYLVARHVMDELRTTANAARIQDEVLFALLSHQVWMARPSIVDFATEIFQTLPDDEQSDIRQALDELLRSYRQRRRSATLDSYRPVPLDFVRQLATYSANLFTLAISFADPPRELHLVGPFGDNNETTLHNWRSTLSLWRSGLDQDSWHAMLFAMEPESGMTKFFGHRPFFPFNGESEFWFATVAGDIDQADRMRQGMAVHHHHLLDIGDPVDIIDSWINGEILHGDIYTHDVLLSLETLSIGRAALRGRLALLLRIRAKELNKLAVRKVLEILFELQLTSIDAILVVTYWHPDVFLEAEEWHAPEHYLGKARELQLIMDLAVDRLPLELHDDWRELRTKLLGADVPVWSSADDEMLTPELLEMLMSFD